MNAVVIPFPRPLAGRKAAPQPIRYVTIDGEFMDDDLPAHLCGRAINARLLYVTPAEYND